MFFLQNTDLPEDPDDPRVDPNYVGSDEEMEDDVDDRDIDHDTNADIDSDDDDNDHDHDDHDGDDHDDVVSGRSQ